MNRWLITGGVGFLGGAILRRLAEMHSDSKFSIESNEILGTCKVLPSRPIAGVEYIELGDLVESVYDSRINKCLNKVQVLVHTVARAHVLKETSVDPSIEFRRINVDTTLELARKAAAAGVRRFIFISSIGVNGQSTVAGIPFSETSISQPYNDYSKSKFEAEQGLWKIAKETDLEVVIIRPPLIYGPNAPGNFRSLMNAIYRGVPLPFGSVQNQRSLVFLGNLVDFIITCGGDSRAANQTFLISDGHDISTAELIRKISQTAGKADRVWHLNYSVLKLAANLIGMSDKFNKLCGNLQVDISKAKDLLGWVPPYSVDEGIKLTVQGRSE